MVSEFGWDGLWGWLFDGGRVGLVRRGGEDGFMTRIGLRKGKLGRNLIGDVFTGTFVRSYQSRLDSRISAPFAMVFGPFPFPNDPRLMAESSVRLTLLYRIAYRT